MGGIQSRRRHFYAQTLPVGYRQPHIEKPLGVCTTFKYKPNCAAPKATIKFSLNTQPPAKPPQKRQRFNSFHSIRNRRTLLPITEENDASQNTTDALTNERTQTKSFPSYSELRDSMRRKKAVKRQDDSEIFEMKIRNNSELKPEPECKNNTKETCVDSVEPTLSIDKEENTENCLNAEIYYYDFDFSNEKLFEDIDEGNGLEETFTQLNYCSDSDSDSDQLKKLSYVTRKEYYYL